MRQFTTNAQSRNTGTVLIFAIVGLLLVVAVGSLLMFTRGQGQQAPIRGGIERPALPDSVGR